MVSTFYCMGCSKSLPICFIVFLWLFRKKSYSERKVLLHDWKQRIHVIVSRKIAFRTDGVAPIAGIMAFHCQRLFQSAELGYFLTARNNTAAANRKTSRYRKNSPVL